MLRFLPAANDCDGELPGDRDSSDKTWIPVNPHATDQIEWLIEPILLWC